MPNRPKRWVACVAGRRKGGESKWARSSRASRAGLSSFLPLRTPATQAKAMRGEYIPMILSQGWIIGFEKASEMSSETAAEFGFFPVSTKMKAQWACANTFRRLKSSVISFVVAIFCYWVKTRAKSGIDRHICGAAIQIALKRFHWSHRVDR